MARALVGRLMITGRLMVRTPLHVGGFGTSVETDLPLARDGRGRLYVPGTSLAGPIRHWFQTTFQDNDGLVGKLWGFQDGDQGRASQVFVENSLVQPEGVVDEIRDGVGIDRVLGAAARHIKYDRAVLPRGSWLDLAITVEIDPKDNVARIKAMFGHLIDALCREDISFGAARTRGLGRVRLEDAKAVYHDLATRSGILDLLRGRGEVLTPEQLRGSDPELTYRPRPQLVLEIAWHALLPVMVKAGYDGIAVDMLPLVSGWDDRHLAPILPGSAIKGVFRSQAERIVRTVLEIDAEPDAKDTQGFLRQLKVDLVTSLFGTAGEAVEDDQEDESEEDDDGDDPRPGLGALGIADCYAEHTMVFDHWSAIESAGEDQALREALNAAGCRAWAQAYHVAVDRWTGSAADGFLYNVLEPHDVAWGPIVLRVDLARLAKDERLPALALLFLVLRDLAQQRLPLGFATNRGMGAVAVDRVSVRGDGLADELAELEHVVLENGRLDGLSDRVRGTLTSDWQSWIQKHQKHQKQRQPRSEESQG